MTNCIAVAKQYAARAAAECREDTVKVSSREKRKGVPGDSFSDSRVTVQKEAGGTARSRAAAAQLEAKRSQYPGVYKKFEDV